MRGNEVVETILEWGETLKPDLLLTVFIIGGNLIGSFYELGIRSLLFWLLWDFAVAKDKLVKLKFYFLGG
jgi:hypothetical protein